ncbi:MAG: hypothetical protein ABW153_08915 [Sedimenticola sp.]
MSEAGGKEQDYLAVDIACLNRETLRATLVSSAGSHCEVWRTNKRIKTIEDEESYHEFVIKYPTSIHSRSEIAILMRDYRRLKNALEEIIPSAVFFVTEVDGQPNVCVIADAVNIWFNIANPQNREEAVELLRASPRARGQLERFVRTARDWRNSDDSRLIDLYGLDNLIMDKNREIRYLDSFYVFFYEDLLDLLQEEPDDLLKEYITASVERLGYLEEILEASSLSR